MLKSRRFRSLAVAAALAMVMSMVAAGTAEARMGGSFGSRGMRTFQSAPITRTAPSVVSPIQRSMTPYGAAAAGQSTSAFGQSRGGGFWGGVGGGIVGGLLGGLFFHGLFGSMMGYGFGGFGGGIALLFQMLLIFWIGSWFLRRLRGHQQSYGAGDASYRESHGGPYAGPGYGSGIPSGSASRRPGTGHDEIGVSDSDLETFENRLIEVQEAFSREDHAGLRRYTTPEMVSFLSEELADNATNGVRNDVKDVRFIQGDVAEAWREGERDYVTVAIKWSAIDVMVDRQSGQVVKGDAETPAEATELWTFVRANHGDWLLSAIQQA